jgi:hypothetical protein
MECNKSAFNRITPVKKAVILALTATLLFVSATNGLGAATVSAAALPQTLIDTHTVWRFNDSNTDLFGDVASDFRSKAYDDSAWKSGPQPIGYPASEDDKRTFGKISEVGTLTAYKANPNAYITYYLRTEFSVSDIADISALNAEISFDDGYQMYLNGHPVDSMYMTAGAIGHSTAADYVNEASSAEGSRVVDLSAYRQFLVEGDGNVIAVDLHNRDQNSSDIYWGMKLTALYEEEMPAEEETPVYDADVTPAQVNAHMGDNPASQVNFTYTTKKPAPSTVTLTDGGESLTFTGESSVGASNKYFHKIAVSGLSADTSYSYVLGEAPNSFAGKFKTAPEAGSKDSFRFVYLADTQVSNATNAEALGATLAEVANMNPDFVYLAGDITDTATSEDQWQWMFNNAGSFPNGGREMFGNYLIAAIQGNHDNNTFNRHINAPAQQGNIVYSFDYGPATFIMLNLETARSDASARAAQLTFLENAVAEAKARGQWVAAGFHKSLYTGASHITDSDVVDARKFWCPEFAKLDVDFVLQGHDHVYSRGFVAEDGTKAIDAPVGSAVADPANAPLYMIGGHAGGLKWYSQKNYTVASQDPLIPGYAFLDVDSANPAHNQDNQGSDTKQEQVIVELNVSEEEVVINCYMFKYNTTSDTIETPKYLYDTLTVRKAAETPEEPPTEEGETTASISGPSSVELHSGDEITYVVSYANLVNANAFNTVIEYDNAALEFVRAESLPGNVLISSVDANEDGKVGLITGLNAVTESADKLDVAAFVFKVREQAQLGETIVKLLRADTVSAQIGEDGSIVGATDVAAAIADETAATDITEDEIPEVPTVPGDANGDGAMTLADLSIALAHYQSTDEADLELYDLNSDGVIDTADYILICVAIRSA